jgi:hypothetical protein
MGGTGSYWRRVARRAWQDTDWFTWGKAVSAVGLLAVREILRFRAGLGSLPELVQTLIVALLAYALVAVVAYLVNLTKAPAKMAEEQDRALSELRERERKQTDVDRLADLRVVGARLLNERVSEARLADWTRREAEWRNSVTDVLRERFTQAQVLKFNHLGSFPASSFSGVANADHDAAKGRLHRRLQLLEEVISTAEATIAQIGLASYTPRHA